MAYLSRVKNYLARNIHINLVYYALPGAPPALAALDSFFMTALFIELDSKNT